MAMIARHATPSVRRRWPAAVLLWAAANMLAYWGLSRRGTVIDQRSPLSASVLNAFTERELVTRSAGGQADGFLRYRLLEPAGGDRVGRFPVLLFLHGAGQRGRDNVSQLRGLPAQMTEPSWRGRFPCFLIAPQCVERGQWIERLPDLRSLVEEVLKDPRADRGRVYVTGLSMGGYGTWALAAAHPELFAAAVPICGGGEPGAADRLIGVPVWAVHGDEDEIVSVDRSREMVAAVRSTGGRVRYTELPGVGHDSWTATYADPDGVIPWMFRKSHSAQP